MKIIVSQQDKKTSVNFIHKDVVDKFVIDKAEEFLVCVDRVVKTRHRQRRSLNNKSSFYYPVDKLLKKRHTVKISDFRDAKLEFEGRVGMLTERVVRAIMLGFRF